MTTPLLPRVRSRFGPALVAGIVSIAGLASPAAAQWWCTERVEVECQQRVIVMPPMGQNWSGVRSRQFVHAWSANYWNPVSSSYIPAGQPPNFKRWGIDSYNPANDLIYNQEFLGVGLWTPAVLANRFTRTVPPGGTPPAGFQVTANATWASALSRVDIKPRGPMNEVDATLRTFNTHEVGNGSGYHGRAFGFTEVLLELPMQWWWNPPTFSVVQKMERFRVGHPACGWWIYNYYPTTPPSINVRRMRLFDPIRFTAAAPDGTVLDTGVIYENHVDLLSESGRVTMDPVDEVSTWGNLLIDAADADVFLKVGHERFLGDSGELHISVRGGVVIESWGSGPWTWSAPPVGLAVPFTVAIQTQVAGTLDLGHLVGREFAVTIATGDGGAQPPENEPDLPPPPPTCRADFDGDGSVDFFDYDAFVVCFEVGACPEGRTSDFDEDGTIDFFDYDAFVRAYEAGC